MKLLLIPFLFASCTPQEIPHYEPVTTELDSMGFYVNQERLSRGLKPLVAEKRLNGIAEEKTLLMFQTGLVSHNGFVTRSEQSGAEYFSENLAFGFCSQRELFQAYMKSATHKENIINKDITHIGSSLQQRYNCTLFAKYQ